MAAYAEAIASIVSARSLCNSIDLDVGCLLPSILKFAALLRLMILRDASFVFSAGFEGWIVGQLPTASEPGQRHEARKEITVRDYGLVLQGIREPFRRLIVKARPRTPIAALNHGKLIPF